MATALTVYAYGNVDALHGIFNAVAMITNSSDFEAMVRVGVVLGFAVVATLALLPGNLQKGWTWFLAVTVVSGAMLIPKATVSIEDKLAQQPTVVVANVPWSLAFMASVKSTIGAGLTEMFETAFQTIPAADKALPSELSYLRHGMMFGSRMVRSSRDAVPENMYDQSDLVQYIRNCVFPEMGRYATPNAVLDAKDVRSAMASTNMGLASSYHNPNANWKLEVDGCANVWTALQSRLNTAGAEAVKKAAARDLPALYKHSPADAVDALEKGLPAIYGKAALAAANTSAADVMIQNILINATADAAALQGAAINDSSMIQLAAMRTQAVAQMNAGNVVQGRIAEESLPLIRNITEGILYACFPVLCILLVASEARALGALFKSYVYALVWVELWPPMFAIVNYLQTLEAAKSLAGAGYLPGGGSGMTMGTASAVYTTAVSGLGTAAWMVTFVPVVAAACLFGFDRIMTITGAMGGGQRAAQGEAANATKGNLALGGVSMHQQQLMASWTDPTTYKRDTLGGTEFGSALTGGAGLSQFREASAPVSLSDTAAVTRGMAAEATAAQASAQRNSKAFESSIDAAYGQVQAVLKGHSATAQKALGFDVSKMSSDGVLESESKEATDNIARKYGIQDDSEVRKSIQAGAATPGLLSLGGALSSSERESLVRDVTQTAQDLQKRGTQRKQEVVDQFRSNSAFEEVRRSNRDATERVDSSWRDAKAYKEAESADFTRSQQLSAKIEGAQRFARESTARWNNLLDDYARVHFGVSVHDGVADPRQWQGIVRSFIESGTIRTDTDDGRVMWIAPDAGMGPSFVDMAPVQRLAAGGQAQLRADFDAGTPGGGRAAVETMRVGNDSAVAARGRQLGVAPGMGVNPAGLPGQVTAHHTKAHGAVDAAESATRTSAGSARVELEDRAGQVSTTHRPMLNQNPFTGDRIANKALEGVQGTDGTRPTGFKDDAEAVRKQREAEAEQLRKGARNVRIPR